MMQKQNSISDVVAGHFPYFVQEDYPTFIAFVEAYYTFLNSQKLTRSLENIKDVNTSLDDFISLIKREVAPDVPVTNRFFISNVKKFHLARGSEESYRTLFRLLLKKEIDILYPAEKMLRVSDGQWQQDISFFIKVTTGNPFVLQNDFLYVAGKSAGNIARRHKVFVKKIQQVETATDIYEVFITRNYFGEISVGDTISYKGVVAKIVPTTSKIKVIYSGSGFKVGQVFNIDTPTGSGTLVKVTKITDGGGIARLQLVSFGVGYPRDFFFDIVSKSVAKPYQLIKGKSIESGDVVNENSDYGIINANTYHTDFVDSNYVGDVLGTFYSATAEEAANQTLVASLKIELGAIAVYPGYYASARSLIDDDSYIQDGEYYQDFSYVIRLDEKLTTYKDAVLSMLHPAGRKMFGEFLIDSAFNLEIQISNPLIRILIPQYSESDESFDALDHTVFRVVDVDFIGDNVKFKWSLSPEYNSSESVVTRVRINENDYQDWFIDADTDEIVFYDTPPANAKIQIRYAVRRFLDNETLQSSFFDLYKRFTETEMLAADVVNTKHVDKQCNSTIESINSSGTIQKNAYQADTAPYFAENYLFEERVNF